MLDILSHQGNANQNNPEIPTSHQSDWPRYKIQMTIDNVEDVDKEEQISTAVGAVN